MMRHGYRGFTLIELLLVLSIIVILMSLLVPSMNAAIMAVKTKDTEQRIAMIHKAVEDYAHAYNAYPPDTSPDRTMDKNDPTSYPPYIYPDGSEADYLFYHELWLSTPYGGKLLVYFLMGPTGTGWHRPRTASTTDPNYRNRYITAEWEVPVGLAEYVENSPVSQGCASSYAVPVFLDAFGLEDKNGGTIGYKAANPLESDDARWGGYGLYSAFYGDCRSHPGYPGDDRFRDHMARELNQCPYSFALISPGADRKFGYRVYGEIFNGQYMKGSWSDYNIGRCDDLANYPLK